MLISLYKGIRQASRNRSGILETSTFGEGGLKGVPLVAWKELQSEEIMLKLVLYYI